jgi:hypothetical protein
MGRPERIEILRSIEQSRGSRVLAFITGDRPPAGAQLGDDAVRPLYDHLRELGHVDRLDLLLYSRGGAIDVPWRIATAFRRIASEWNVLIPFRANSAATLLSLGADNIILGRQGELGPIDPILSLQRVVPQPGGGVPSVQQENINVEDVMAYVRFLTERAGLSDQTALTQGMTLLGQRLDAVLLGSLYRTHSHIRDLAKRMLLSRVKPASEQQVQTIVDTLAEKVYAHGHAIGLREAQEMGLPVVEAPTDVDDAMWRLLQDFEVEMKLLEPLDPAVAVQGGDTYRESAVVAAIETTTLAHHHQGEIEVTARRQMPAQLNVGIQINVQPPPGVDANNLPAALQQMLQAFQQALQLQAQQAVQQALAQQAPMVGLEVGFRGGRWVRSD